MAATDKFSKEMEQLKKDLISLRASIGSLVIAVKDLGEKQGNKAFPNTPWSCHGMAYCLLELTQLNTSRRRWCSLRGRPSAVRRMDCCFGYSNSRFPALLDNDLGPVPRKCS